MVSWLDGRAGWARWVWCFCLLLGVGVAEWTTKVEVAFTLAYLLPVAMAAWHIGLFGGGVLAIAATGTAVAVDLLIHRPQPHPAILVVNVVAQLMVFAFFGVLLSHLRRLLDQTHLLATTDPLTGLSNRRTFLAAAEREVARARRFGHAFSIAYIDVDDFKSINDRLGHHIGDQVLVAIAGTLVGSVRNVDCVARMGGDEFALLLPETDDEGAATVVAKLAAQLESAEWNLPYRIRCSIGCLTVQDPTVAIETVIARADALMYEIKARSRGTRKHANLAAGAR